MPYVIEDGYIVWVTEGDGGATVTAQDGSDDSFSPAFMVTMASDSNSLNVETTLLNGETAVTLVGDADPTGTLSFVFTDDFAVAEAREILRRPTSFELEVPARPSLNMTFVRSGNLGATIHDQIKEVWEVSVGFLAVT